MEIMSTKEVAKLLGVSEMTLYRYRKLGMPYRQIVPNGKVFFELKAVKKWIEEWNDPYAKYVRKHGKL